ncbi:MAG: DUF3276 family protein [Bacteroidetes bacterium]|nr:DUF3276 family protein [Bacteroidota bacterium]
MSDHNHQRDEVFSKSVRAGKRTYFFDVKSTKANDYYLTITESKKRVGDDGSPFFEKHKIFLYREDFHKLPNHHYNDNNNSNTGSFTDVDFDDLGK